MPKIAGLYRKFVGHTDVAFALVSAESFSRVRSFADSSRLKLPFYQSSELPDVYGGQGLPRTYILTKTGEIVHKEYRTAKWDDGSCVAFIKSSKNNRTAIYKQRASIVNGGKGRKNIKAQGVNLRPKVFRPFHGEGSTDH